MFRDGIVKAGDQLDIRPKCALVLFMSIFTGFFYSSEILSNVEIHAFCMSVYLKIPGQNMGASSEVPGTEWLQLKTALGV